LVACAMASCWTSSACSRLSTFPGRLRPTPGASTRPATSWGLRGARRARRPRLRPPQWRVDERSTASRHSARCKPLGLVSARRARSSASTSSRRLSRQPGRAYLFADGTCIDITPPAAGTGASVAVAWTINEAGDSGGYYVAFRRHSRLGARSPRRVLHARLSRRRLHQRARISAAGDLVGVYRLTPTGPNRGFFLSATGDWSPLDYPGSSRSRALGINARGDIVGDYSGGSDCAVNACGWVLRR